MPMPAACRLNTYSRWRKLVFLFIYYSFRLLLSVCLLNICLLPLVEIEAARQRTLVRASVAALKQKEKERTSSFAPKGVTKGSSKRKNEGKDDRPFKKGLAFPVSDKPKKSLLPKPSHRAGKGLMTTTGLVT